MTEILARDDVPLTEAMLMWNDNHGTSDGGTSDEPPIVGDHGRQSVEAPERWDNATCACFGDWRGKSHDRQLIELVRDAWMAVVRDKVDPMAMHEALLAVPEFRALLHPGELPRCYQTEPGE